MFSSLQVRNYRLFFTGQLISNVGTWMQRIAQDWLVFTLSGNNPIALGIAVALQFTPTLLLSLWAGVIADRVDKRRLLIIIQIISCAQAVLIGVLDVTGVEAETDVLYQVAALDGFCRRHGVTMQHVKPHGALYNHANRSPELARAIVAAIASHDPGLLLVCQHGTELARAGEAAGLTMAYEGFADRAYNRDGSLVSRAIPGSVHHDPRRATEQALRMVTDGTVVALDGTVVDVRVDTLCVHGDNPEAVELVRAVREGLVAAGVALRSLSASAADDRAG